MIRYERRTVALKMVEFSNASYCYFLLYLARCLESFYGNPRLLLISTF